MFFAYIKTKITFLYIWKLIFSNLILFEPSNEMKIDSSPPSSFSPAMNFSQLEITCRPVIESSFFIRPYAQLIQTYDIIQGGQGRTNTFTGLINGGQWNSLDTLFTILGGGRGNSALFLSPLPPSLFQLAKQFSSRNVPPLLVTSGYQIFQSRWNGTGEELMASWAYRTYRGFCFYLLFVNTI